MSKIVISLVCTLSVATAEFESWTDKSGRIVELELLSVSKTGDTTSGKFRMKNGQVVSLQSSKLVDSDAKKMSEWKGGPTSNGPRYAKSSIHSEDDPFAEVVDPKNPGFSYWFFFENPHVIGLKKDSLSFPMCNLSKVTATAEKSSHIVNSFTDTRKPSSKKAWILSDTSYGHFSNGKSDPSKLIFEICLKNDGLFTQEQLDTSSFSAGVVAATSSKSKEEDLRFSPTDVRSWLDQDKKAVVKNVGAIKLWLEHQHEDLFSDSESGIGPRLITVNFDDPYEPSCVKSTQIL